MSSNPSESSSLDQSKRILRLVWNVALKEDDEKWVRVLNLPGADAQVALDEMWWVSAFELGLSRTQCLQ